MRRPARSGVASTRPARARRPRVRRPSCPETSCRPPRDGTGCRSSRTAPHAQPRAESFHVPRCQIQDTGYPTVVAGPSSNCARLASRPIDEGGTAVETWIEWGRRFTPLNIDRCPALVLVAAHPDDETLGLGATAA